MGVMSATPVSSVVRKAASASTARNNEISWTRALVSFGDALAERSCESFASRQGCVETCTLEGRRDMTGYVVVVVMMVVMVIWLMGGGDEGRGGGIWRRG